MHLKLNLVFDNSPTRSALGRLSIVILSFQAKKRLAAMHDPVQEGSSSKKEKVVSKGSRKKCGIGKGKK
jgi:hypothetical protein